MKFPEIKNGTYSTELGVEVGQAELNDWMFDTWTHLAPLSKGL
jgi:hypothetical protein